MAHTNSTPNYNLPQFLPTDKPAWLVDVNPAYAAIDTAIKNASDAAGNAQGDATQALSDAAGAQAIATQANTKADGAIASISEQFLDTATYTAGEYVIFNNILYVCTEPVTTPGPWTGSVNWTRASVDSIATSLKTDVNNLNNRTGSNIPVSDSETDSIATSINNLSSIGRFTATGSSHGGFEFKEINKIKVIFLRNLSGLAANALTTLDFTLPERFRPIENICYFDIKEPSSNYTFRLIINPSGVVQIYNYGTQTGSSNVNYIGAYI